MNRPRTAIGVDQLDRQLAPVAIVNRLRVGHLLLWITATAAVMSFFQPTRAMQAVKRGDADESAIKAAPSQRADVVILTIVGPAIGAGVAAVILCMWRLMMRRFGFPTQAGHWLLLIVGGCFTISVGAGAIQNRIFKDSGSGLALIGLLLTMGVIPSVAAWRLKSPGYWRVAFALCGGGFDALLVHGITATIFYNSVGSHDALNWLVSIGDLVAILAIVGGIGLAIVCGLVDFVRRAPVDLFHWVGVISFWIVVCVPCMGFFLAS